MRLPDPRIPRMRVPTFLLLLGRPYPCLLLELELRLELELKLGFELELGKEYRKG